MLEITKEQLANAAHRIAHYIGLQIPTPLVECSPYGNCPNCDYEFNSELLFEYKVKHCPNCGQKVVY